MRCTASPNSINLKCFIRFTSIDLLHEIEKTFQLAYPTSYITPPPHHLSNSYTYAASQCNYNPLDILPNWALHSHRDHMHLIWQHPAMARFSSPNLQLATTCTCTCHAGTLHHLVRSTLPNHTSLRSSPLRRSTFRAPHTDRFHPMQSYHNLTFHSRCTTLPVERLGFSNLKIHHANLRPSLSKPHSRRLRRLFCLHTPPSL